MQSGHNCCEQVLFDGGIRDWRLGTALLLAMALGMAGCLADDVSLEEDEDDPDPGPDPVEFDATAYAMNQAIEIDWEGPEEGANLYWSSEPDFDPDNYTVYENSGSATEVEPPYLVEDLENDLGYYFYLEHEGKFSDRLATFPMSPGVTSSTGSLGSIASHGDERLIRLGNAGPFPLQATRNPGGLVKVPDDGGALLPVPMVNGEVLAIEQDGEGGYVIGGNFTRVDGQPRKHLARIDEDGELDLAWRNDVELDGEHIDARVWELSYHDGRIHVGGEFDSVGGSSRSNAAAVRADGGLVNDWQPDFDDSVTIMAISDAVIYVAGDFEEVGGTPRERLAAINHDGSLDQDWQADANNFVNALSLDPDGNLYAGGQFTEIDGIPREFLAMIDEEGDVDEDFAETDNWVEAVLHHEGELYVAGSFSGPYDLLTAIDGEGEARRWIDDLPESEVSALGRNWELDSVEDGILLSGNFNRAEGEERRGAALYNSEGELLDDPGLDMSPYFYPRSIKEAEEGYLVGLLNLAWGSYSHPGIASFGMDGEPQSWNVGFVFDQNQQVFASATDGDRLYVAGQFRDMSNGAQRAGFVAFDMDEGSLVGEWAPTGGGSSPTNPWSGVVAMEAEDGDIFVGGGFSEINGETHERLARLNEQGEVNDDFPTADGDVEDIVLYNGILYIAGEFEEITDGDDNTHERDYVAAIDADTGEVESWEPELDDEATAITARDGWIYIGGDFEDADGAGRDGLAAYNVDSELQDWNPETDEAPSSVSFLKASSLGIFAGVHGVSEIGGQELPGSSALLDPDDGSADPNFAVETITFEGNRIHGITPFGDGQYCLAFNNPYVHYKDRIRSGFICIDEELELVW